MNDGFSDDWITAEMIVDWAMYDLGMGSSTKGLPDADISKIMHYVGVWATRVETPAIDSPRISPFGISMMLSVCLQVFPDYYERYQLSQFN